MRMILFFMFIFVLNSCTLNSRYSENQDTNTAQTEGLLSPEEATKLMAEQVNIGTGTYLPADKKPFDLEQFKKLLKAGANVNWRGPGGASVFSVLSRAWALLPNSDSRKKDFFEAIRLVVATGKPDLYISTNMGLNPLHEVLFAAYAGSFQHKEEIPDTAPYFKLLSESGLKFDVNARTAFGTSFFETALIMVSDVETLKMFVALGATLDSTITDAGYTPIHAEALSGYIEENPLLETLFGTDAYKKLISKNAFDGTSPLMGAVIAGEYKAVQVLVEKWNVDVQVTNEAGFNAYSYLKLVQQQWLSQNNSKIKNTYAQIEEYLVSKGAAVSPLLTKDWTCDGPNYGVATAGRILQIADKCQIDEIDQLLAILPKEYLRNHLKFYETRGLGVASTEFPRIVMYDSDGKVYLSFSGKSGTERFNNLEVIEFSETEQKSTLDLFDIETKRGGKWVAQKNPAVCMSCHTTPSGDHRLIWDQWGFSPGVYGSQQGLLIGQELESYQTKFLPNQSQPRYRHLLEASSLGLFVTQNRADFTNIFNQRGYGLSERVDRTNHSIGISSLINDANLKNYRFAALAAASCGDAIEDYIPQKLKILPNVKPHADLYKELSGQQREDYLERFLRFTRIFPNGPESDSVLSTYNATGVLNSNSLDASRVSKMQYVLQFAGRNMDWSEALIKKFASNFWLLRNFEPHLWRRWLGNEGVDLAIRKHYNGRAESMKSLYRRNEFFRSSDYSPTITGIDATALCAELKSASLSALE